MPNLPLELVNEILLRLPVKPLLRFRCVCKSFCAIIGSQSFENRINHKLIDLRIRRSTNNIMQIHASDSNDDFQQEFVIDKYYPPKYEQIFFSSCNGLVLLCVLSSNFSVWNPSTRKYRILPASPLTGWLHYGLGYDSTADDYKVVLIGRTTKQDMNQVWILELRSSCWRRIQDFPYADYRISGPGGGNGDCFVDGASHFICYSKDLTSSSIILAFDVAKETFSVVTEPVHPSKGLPFHMHVFTGCLSVIVLKVYQPQQCDIYVRMKDEATFTWTKLYSLTEAQFSDVEFICFLTGRFAFSKEGDKVFITSDEKLCSYDLKEKNLQEIVMKHTKEFNIFSCTESLVSVGSQDEVI